MISKTSNEDIRLVDKLYHSLKLIVLTHLYSIRHAELD